MRVAASLPIVAAVRLAAGTTILALAAGCGARSELDRSEDVTGDAAVAVDAAGSDARARDAPMTTEDGGSRPCVLTPVGGVLHVFGISGSVDVALRAGGIDFAAMTGPTSRGPIMLRRAELRAGAWTLDEPFLVEAAGSRVRIAPWAERLVVLADRWSADASAAFVAYYEGAYSEEAVVELDIDQPRVDGVVVDAEGTRQLIVTGLDASRWVTAWRLGMRGPAVAAPSEQEEIRPVRSRGFSGCDTGTGSAGPWPVHVSPFPGGVAWLFMASSEGVVATRTPERTATWPCPCCFRVAPWPFERDAVMVASFEHGRRERLRVLGTDGRASVDRDIGDRGEWLVALAASERSAFAVGQTRERIRLLGLDAAGAATELMAQEISPGRYVEDDRVVVTVAPDGRRVVVVWIEYGAGTGDARAVVLECSPRT